MAQALQQGGGVEERDQVDEGPAGRRRGPSARAGPARRARGSSRISRRDALPGSVSRVRAGTSSMSSSARRTSRSDPTGSWPARPQAAPSRQVTRCSATSDRSATSSARSIRPSGSSVASVRLKWSSVAMPTKRSRVAWLMREVERPGHADVDRRGEVALPRQRDPPHQPAQAGGLDGLDLLHLVGPRLERGWIGRPGGRHGQGAEHRAPASSIGSAELQQRADQVGEVVATEQEEGHGRSAQTAPRDRLIRTRAASMTASRQLSASRSSRIEWRSTAALHGSSRAGR